MRPPLLRKRLRKLKNKVYKFVLYWFIFSFISV